ncbi:MAG TPA: efflux RND transporter periplasmic adaptor subunit [Steroidobacteraceae bacterium]|nr:efflux RND transporter periplasmic adaptor subunit [Steroidobacteraceae bacterium]
MTDLASRGVMMSAGNWKIAAIVIVLVAGVSWAAVHYATRTQMYYQTARVSRGTVAPHITASGTVNPVTTIQVGSYVSGVIQEIKCDFNTRVKKGQLCARIDPRPYQTIVDQDMANLATAQAQLEKDKAGLQLARQTDERNSQLLQAGVVSQDVADTANSAYQQAKSQVVLDEADIRQRQAALSAARVNLGYTSIVSPVDGTVISRNVTQGQTVAASFQTPTLFLIATDLTQMQVDSNVSESDIGSVAAGDQATFRVEAYPERTFNGAVVQVRQAPQTVQNVVTYDVVIGFSNAALLLKPGMTAAISIFSKRHDNVLRVPNQALRYLPGGIGNKQVNDTSATQVFVERNGKPQRVMVVTGLVDDSYTEILQGELKVDDRVIISEQVTNPAGTRSTASLRMPRM